MKKLFFVSIFCAFYLFLSAQNIINVSKDLRLPDTYTSLQSAVDVASAGDTIHVHPHGLEYGNATITKKLVIIGSGYNIDEQDDSLGIRTFTENSKLGTISYNAGSDSSVIMGCEIGTLNLNDPVKYVKVLRNVVNSGIRLWGADSITINGCYIVGYIYYQSYYYASIRMYNTSQGNICTNNLLTNVSTYNRSIIVNENSSALVQRNIMLAPTNEIDYSTVVDNVIRGGTMTSLNSVVTNNVFMANLTQYAGDNLIDQGSSGIFVGYPDQLTYSFDSRWMLAPGSPAIGYAFDGGDCGIYGGDHPYKLSGVPAVPLIYELTPVNNVIIENDSLHINIKIRSEQ
jgi:hypothetical protein